MLVYRKIITPYSHIALSSFNKLKSSAKFANYFIFPGLKFIALNKLEHHHFLSLSQGPYCLSNCCCCLPFSFSGEFPIYSDPQVDLVALNVNMLTIGGSDLNLEIKLTNANEFELLVERVNYRVSVGNFPIGDGNIGGDKSIPSHGEKMFQLPMLLNFFEVGKDVYAFLQQDTASCRFSGEIEIHTVWGRLQIPFDVSKDITVNKSSS